jgi:hypothetical protein
VAESIGAILPELRSSGDFATALVWDAEHRRPVVLDGDAPPPELDRELLHGRRTSKGRVLRLAASRPSDHGLEGWAVPLPAGEHWVVLLAAGPPPASLSQGVFADILAGVAMIVTESRAVGG